MSRGAQRERAVRDWLTERDWIVFHTRPGTNICDVVALKDGYRPRFVEVKSTAGGPYERFLPARRHDLRQAAEWAGADAFLAWWPPRGQLHWIHASEWPTRLKVAMPP